MSYRISPTRLVMVLSLALSAAWLGQAWGAQITPLTDPPTASGVGYRKVLARGVGVAAIGSSNILSAAVTPGAQASKLEVEVAVASATSLYYTVSDGTTTSIVALNGGTALTAGVGYNFAIVVNPSYTYNFRLSSSATLSTFVLSETSGASSASRTGPAGGSSGGGGSSDPALGGSLGGTASAATVLALDGSPTGTVNGPTSADLVLQGATGHDATLKGGSGGGNITAQSGTNGGILLQPDGSGTIQCDGTLDANGSDIQNVGDFTFETGNRGITWTSDQARIYASATKTLTLDDGGGGAAHLTVPGAGSQSQTFGPGAHAGGSSGHVFGYNATDNDKDGDAVFGWTAQATHNESTVVGTAAQGHFGSAIVGYSATCGTTSNSSGLGHSVVISHDGVICLGRDAASTKTKQCVIGSAGVPIDEIRVVGTAGAWAITPASFFAYRAVDQTITTGTATTVVCDTAVFNKGSCYSTSTGLFTAPVAGVYEFTASLLWTVDPGVHYLEFTQNVAGTPRTWRVKQFAANGYSPQSSGEILLAAGDTMAIRVTHSAGADRALDGAADTYTQVSFSGHLVAGQ